MPEKERETTMGGRKDMNANPIQREEENGCLLPFDARCGRSADSTCVSKEDVYTVLKMMQTRGLCAVLSPRGVV